MAGKETRKLDQIVTGQASLQGPALRGTSPQPPLMTSIRMVRNYGVGREWKVLTVKGTALECSK